MIIGIPVYQHVDLLDVTAPHEVLKWTADMDVRLLAASLDKPIVTRDGFRFLPTHRFADTDHLDVLWVPGGDPDKALKPMMSGAQPEYVDFLKRIAPSIDKQYKEGKTGMICSVCEGALLLAAAGLLNGYKATTHWLFIPCLNKFRDVEIVDGLPRFQLDRNRLTGGGISSGLDESLQLLRMLKGDDAAHGVQRTIQYYPEPPFRNDLEVPDKCAFDL
jgi:transcriptional regulator GlxA family with amidase domain